MTKLRAIFLLILNTVAMLGAAGLMLFVFSRPVPDSGVTTERIDAAAVRLAAQPSQSAIAGALHADDTYIRSLLQIGRAQRTLLFWSSAFFASVAVLNILCVFPALHQSVRNA